MERLYRADIPDISILAAKRGDVVRLPGDPEPRVVALTGFDRIGMFADVLTGYDGYLLRCEVNGEQPMDEEGFEEFRRAG